MPIRRRTLSALCIALPLFAWACSKSSETKTASTTTTTAKEAAAPPPPVVRGPVLFAAMVSSIDDKGRPVDRRVSFSPDDPQITLFALAGKTNGAPMDIVWYKTSPEGDQKLFEHHIPVKTLDRAYSIGKNPGTLAAGNYKATVTLEGQTREVLFDVTPKKTSQRAAAGTAPVSGASGTVPQPPRKAGSANPCHIHDAVSDEPRIVTLIGVEVCGEKNFPLLVTAAIDGGKPSPVPVVDEFMYPVNPCSPSFDKFDDFPGTKITFTVEGTSGRSPRETEVFSLPPDTVPPEIRWLPPTPADNSEVEVGKPIVLSVIADDADHGRSWQSGISTLQIVKKTGGLIASIPVQPLRPHPCGTKRQAASGTYLVPNEATFEICADAEDYADHKVRSCREFRTGPTFTGTWHYESSRQYTKGPFCKDAWDGTLSFVVGPDGALQGDASAKLAQVACAIGGIPPVPSRVFSLAGRQTASGDFELRFTSAGPPDPDRTGDMVSGNLLLAGSSSQCFNASTPTIILRKQANGIAAGNLELRETPFLPQCPNAADVMAIKAHFEVKKEQNAQNVSEKPTGVDAAAPAAVIRLH